MTIIDKVTEPVKVWLWNIALKKILARGVTLLVAWILNLGLQKYGIVIDEVKVTAGIYLALEWIRNWAKVKFPSIAAWL